MKGIENSNLPPSNQKWTEERHWRTPPELWTKLKPLARQMRREPTPAEKALWQHLRKKQLGVKFRRQHTIDRFILDFYCRDVQLVVEVDGPIHDYTPKEDVIRQEFLESQGLRVVRFSNEQVLRNLEGVLEAIKTIIRQPPGSLWRNKPHPPAPSPQEGKGSKIPPPRHRGGG